MKTDTLKTYRLVRQKLLQEKAQIENRLRQINDALALPTTPLAGAAIKVARMGRWPKTRRGGVLGKGGNRTISPEGRARIAAKLRARWAKIKASGRTKL